MVDNLIRQQKDKLEAASDEARLRLREWDMPEALQASCHLIMHLSFVMMFVVICWPCSMQVIC